MTTMATAMTAISILFGSVSPAKVDVLAGEQVAWTNSSVRNHTVTDDGGAFDSGSLAPNSHFTHVFAQTGTYTYHCRLHPYIRGEVDVHDVLLDRPIAPAASGTNYPLSGRAAAEPGTTIAIQFDDGSGFQPVGQATVGPDGGFTANVQPTASGNYEAVLGDETSPAVPLLVLDRSISAQTRRTRAGTRVSVLVTPSSPGQTVVLQLRLKERFGWWPVAQKKLGESSRATFMLRIRRRVLARVLLTLPDGATPLATSKALRVP
jgi:hypothetical protein